MIHPLSGRGLGPLAVLALGLAACSTGVSPTSDPESELAQVGAFKVVSISPQQGQVVALNTEVEVVFSADVDFATVNSNTIQIVAIGGAGLDGQAEDLPATPAVGTFAQGPTLDTVLFFPKCPQLLDGSDAGLGKGLMYTVRLRGLTSGGPVVRSAAGEGLAQPASLSFWTQRGSDLTDLFTDSLPGPPDVVFRDQGSTDEAATYLELGLDPNAAVYFERDPGGNIDLPLGFLAPINPYSRIEERVSWILQLDQNIQASPENLARAGLEGLDSSGTWVALATEVELQDNCSSVAPSLRLTPRGILPQASQVRARLAQGFADLTGDAIGADLLVALAPIATSFDPGTQVAGDDGDQRWAGFTTGGLEDTQTQFEVPRASWSSGRLQATGNFPGTGGPGGDFDWHIPPDTVIILDTTLDIIFGGPGGVPTTTQTVINGVVDIRDLFIPSTSAIICLGPNPVTLLATGKVTIEGRFTVNGSNSAGVGTLNTTNQPEPGAPGQCGGGRGGTGSWMTNQSTPYGGPGFGPFQVPGAGGQGGETSYALGNKQARRAAGGGGGGHARDVRYDFKNDGVSIVRAQARTGMDAESGAPGGLNGTGAVSQNQRAQGGAIGVSPFLDGVPGNDFSGLMTLTGGGLVKGELDTSAPGSGGGAGGDAVNSDTFPLEPFLPTGDEKGAGGGGGGGKLHVLALGPILVGATGEITAEGGHGNGGENTSFFDRVGGGSGGGSGGSIVLETLDQIVIAGVAQNAGDSYRDDPNLSAHGARPIRARGGQGGTGNDNHGGANETGPTVWRCDAIPIQYAEGHLDLAPFFKPCYKAQPDLNDPSGFPSLGAGGDGAPGVIQFHVPEASDLRLLAAPLDPTQVCNPAPVGYDPVTEAWSGHLLPAYGPRSRAQSIWMPLGLARHNPAGPDDQVALFFGGVNLAGEVLADPTGEVQLEPALVGPDLVVSAPATPYVDVDLYTMVFDSTGIAGFDDVYERNPMLLRGGSVLLSLASQPDVKQDFEVVQASYDPALDRLAVTVTADAGPLTGFNPASDVQAALIPRSFRVEAAGWADRLGAPDTRITFTWDATLADGAGAPDESASWSALNGAFTANPADLNGAPWDFVRVRIDFDLDASNSGFDPLSPLPSLEFLRVPFRF
jgi:hypothetical protein